jgi:hypothetical protein
MWVKSPCRRVRCLSGEPFDRRHHASRRRGLAPPTPTATELTFTAPPARTWAPTRPSPASRPGSRSQYASASRLGGYTPATASAYRACRPGEPPPQPSPAPAALLVARRGPVWAAWTQRAVAAPQCAARTQGTLNPCPCRRRAEPTGACRRPLPCRTARRRRTATRSRSPHSLRPTGRTTVAAPLMAAWPTAVVAAAVPRACRGSLRGRRPGTPRSTHSTRSTRSTGARCSMPYQWAAAGRPRRRRRPGRRCGESARRRVEGAARERAEGRTGCTAEAWLLRRAGRRCGESARRRRRRAPRGRPSGVE